MPAPTTMMFIRSTVPVKGFAGTLPHRLTPSVDGGEACLVLPDLWNFGHGVKLETLLRQTLAMSGGATRKLREKLPVLRDHAPVRHDIASIPRQRQQRPQGRDRARAANLELAGQPVAQKSVVITFPGGIFAMTAANVAGLGKSMFPAPPKYPMRFGGIGTIWSCCVISISCQFSPHYPRAIVNGGMRHTRASQRPYGLPRLRSGMFYATSAICAG